MLFHDECNNHYSRKHVNIIEVIYLCIHSYQYYSLTFYYGTYIFIFNIVLVFISSLNVLLIHFQVYGYLTCVYVCQCNMCMPEAQEGHEKELDPLGMEL